MDWFLHTLLPPIGKDIASHFPQTEEAALQIALKYDLIYAQSGYVYTVLPDLPRPSGANASGASHSTDGIIGALSHTSTKPPTGYGLPPGGASTFSTFTPPGSMYPESGIPPPFAHTPAYLNAAHPHPYAQPPMGYGLPLGGASTSSTFPPPGSMYLGYGMPPHFAQPPAYLNVSQPNHYPYP